MTNYNRPFVTTYRYLKGKVDCHEVTSEGQTVTAKSIWIAKKVLRQQLGIKPL